MMTEIVCRGPSLLERVVGPLAFLIVSACGLGVVLSLVVSMAAVFIIQAWLASHGPSRWTE